ncbi:MAG TPA: serine/threonine-protein kinase [Gemmatimonadales bacterium]|nr:serine/threonine-protein kinase [Gemmatimonadales bacterium]
MADLSKELWAKVAPLLDQALDLPRAAREAFVARVRAESPAVADELERLLIAEASPSPDLLATAAVPEQYRRGLAGQSVGKYTLDRPLGHGGMATVWLAHRTDGRFVGQVAVKLLNLALIGHEGEERFIQEGTLLARLTHPNIARLLDAGVTTSGQPFLVLEYVVGERIDRFADGQRATPQQRLDLFLDVLDALAAAHANLIVHRDIKPSNILVTDEGRVKLLDFGIAKLLTDAPASGGTDPATLTDQGGRALTPDYAAPELARGEPVSAATDVYSAGVLLYLLLTGRHPTGEGCRTATEYLRAVLEVEPLRLSDAVGGGASEDVAARASARGSTPERLRRFYAGDLDIIVAKALKKVPAERYQSVAAFVDDLMRFQRHQPIAARPDSWGYRARRFVRRYRAGVVTAAVVALTLVGATVFSLRQVIVARRERDRAGAALRRSQTSTAFESLVFRLIEPGGKPMTYRDLLDKGREVLERRWKGDPESRLQLAWQFAVHYERDGDFDDAAQIERSALLLADSVGLPDGRARARCELAFVQAKRQFADSARALVREARGLLQRASDPETETLNICDDSEGEALIQQNKDDSAAIPLRARVDRFVSAGDTTSSDYIFALNDLARAFFLGGITRPARETELRVLAASHQGALSDPQALPIGIHNAATTYEVLGELHDEQEFFRREIAYAGKIDTTSAAFALVFYDYGMLLDQLSQGDSARAWLLRSLTYPDEIGGPRVYTARLTLARIARGAGQTAEAEQHRVLAAGIAGGAGNSPTANALAAADRIAAAHLDRPHLLALIQHELDGIHYTPQAKGRALVAPLAAAVAALITAGADSQAAEYAAAVVRIGTVDSLTPQRSAIVGRGLLLGAQVAAAARDTAGAKGMLRRAIPPLTFGLGTAHPLYLHAVALRDSLGP